ncbi:MAG: hypothetical protein HKP21_13900 [Xanthomonadales bacterium]|nr:hypothetical protein [Gammaproteobacteria bacterium]NNK05640.1 hypothetical protein [Xanthomonadales bacterium]NNK99308.1 hypothetical protein [Xanthomonadales bacterium]
MTATLLLLLTPAYAGADDRPVIEVKFSIEGAIFNEEINQAIQPEIEQMISTRAAKSLGYLNWIPSSPTLQETAQWNVTLKVEKVPVTTDDGGTTSGFIGTLKHRGVLADQEFMFDQTEENETIYPLGRPIPAQERTILVNDISAQLDKQLETLFKSPQVKAYLRNIPIVDEVIADNELVLIPVKKRDLRTEADSVLAVEFKHNEKTGRLDLETTDEVTEEGQYEGYVIARVMDLRLVPITIVTPTYWDEKLSPIIDSAEEVKVFMLSYSPSLSGGLDAENGVVSEPDS